MTTIYFLIALIVPMGRITHHDVQVLLCWPGHLKAFPCISRAAVQQFGPSHVILSWNTDLPVPINHELGMSILKSWFIQNKPFLHKYICNQKHMGEKK